MSEILLVDNNEEEKLKYEATEEDEEKFFLIYHLHLQVSEVDRLDPDRRRWLITRFVTQKGMEREAMQQARIAQALPADLSKSPNLRMR